MFRLFDDLNLQTLGALTDIPLAALEPPRLALAPVERLHLEPAVDFPPEEENSDNEVSADTDSK